MGYIFNFLLLILISRNKFYGVFPLRISSQAISTSDEWRYSLRGNQPMAAQHTKHQMLIPRAGFKSATAAISQSVTVRKATLTIVSIGKFDPLFCFQNFMSRFLTSESEI